MAADIVPVRLGLTNGDLYTLWAPSWRDEDDEWQAFLGKDDDLYAFESVADLVGFVRTSSDNDLADHPAWPALTGANAHSLEPDDEQQHDLIGVPEIVAEKPTGESVGQLLRALAVVQAIGSVCDLTAVAKFFNGNPVLGSLGGGLEAFDGRVGRKRWAEIEGVIGRSWDGVIDAIDAIVSTPDVDAAASEKAEVELAEPAPEVDETEDADEDSDGDSDEAIIEGEVDTDGEEDALAAQATAQVLGDDEDFWANVGIDPIRLLTRGGTYYTLRCYLDDKPIFLGSGGTIEVFGSERALARWLAGDETEDNDLAAVSTWTEVVEQASVGELEVEVDPLNHYVLPGLVDDIAEGTLDVDPSQLELVTELLLDVGEWAGDDEPRTALADNQPLGWLVSFVVRPNPTRLAPSPPFTAESARLRELLSELEERLHRA
ncbi:MAG: primosomal protein [Mycobacterium sp.]